MRYATHALVLAALLIAAPAAGASAATVGEPGAASAATDVQTTPLLARIDRPYGVALRSLPAVYGEQRATLACGEVRHVLARRDGWVQVHDDRGSGWVKEDYVKLGPPSAQIQVDCATARYLPVGSEVSTSTSSGCASLRARPAPFAEERACVEDGSTFEIVSGPYDPDGRAVWFEVWSESTGAGWVLGDQLVAT